MAESAKYVQKPGPRRVSLLEKMWSSTVTSALAIAKRVQHSSLSLAIAAVLAVLTFFGGYPVFTEKISIEPQFSEDNRFALSTRFKIQNNELFGAHSMVFGCEVGPFWSSGNRGQEPVSTLDAGKSVERDCSINGPFRPQVGTRLTWVVEYRPWFRLWRRTSFQTFVARYDSSGRARQEVRACPCISIGPPARDVLIVVSRMTTSKPGHCDSSKRLMACMIDA